MTKKDNVAHLSVMPKETLISLHIKKGGKYIDATVGYAGHTQAMLDHGGLVLGIDQDASALSAARSLLKDYGSKVVLIQTNFTHLLEVAKDTDFMQVDGVLFDLGVSSPQLTSTSRGFSFTNSQAKLDMRMDPESQSVTAADLLNALRKDQLHTMFMQVLDYPQAKKLVDAVINYRAREPFTTVGDFLTCITTGHFSGKTHPATKAFLALRMGVNSELENLQEALPQAFEALKQDGVLSVISFHSTEDRIVKEYFKDLVSDDQAEFNIKDFASPSEAEVSANPRSRSAKLRSIRKK